MIIVGCLVCLLCGCGSAPVGVLGCEAISLEVGERRDIGNYMVFDAADDRRDITLTSDSDCVFIDGSYVVGKEAGSANVVVVCGGKSYALYVDVAYRKPDNIFVVAENLVQTVADRADIEPVKLVATPDDYADPAVAIEWTAPGSTHVGREFVYVPSGYGEYAITATVGGILGTHIAKIYRPTSIDISVVGELNQKDDFSAVTFTAIENVNTLNPRSCYEWAVNGNVIGRNRSFSFTPSAAGEYRVSVTVNGKRRQISNGDFAVITAIGERAPRCAVEFDDEDGVYIRWRDGRGITYVSITFPDGTRKIFNATDAQYSHLFKFGEFDATEYITPCAQTPSEYKIAVGADGRSEFGFVQLPLAAKQYLEKIVLCRNTYVSSVYDAQMLVRESYATGIKRINCYIAADTDAVIAAMQGAAEILGLNINVKSNDKIIELDLGEYVNAPEKTENANIRTAYATLPHIEYKQENYRDEGYVFTAERTKKSVTVVNSEQLLLAIKSGVLPQPQKGSAAETVFGAVKSVLLRIIGRNYSDAQKLHAMYDWLQWTFVKSTATSAELFSGYADGVFAVDRSAGGVCMLTDLGAAKAFMLMCGMEGIACDIVRDGASGCVFNTVKLGDETVSVDVFGGKSTVVGSELTTHCGFALENGLSYAHTQKHMYGDVYFDYYIDTAECADYDMLRAALFNAFDGMSYGNIRIPLPYANGYVQRYNDTLGVEFGLDRALTQAQRSVIGVLLEKAAGEYAQMLGVRFRLFKITFIDGAVLVTAASPEEV